MTKIKLIQRKSGAGSGEKTPESESEPPNGAAAVATSAAAGSAVKKRKKIITSTSSGNDDYIDSQFLKPPAKIPIRSICLAILLCFAGSVLLGLGLAGLTGQLDSTRFEDRVWPMIIMGLLTFIPGAYHTRIFICAMKGVPGYSYEDIPEFE